MQPQKMELIEAVVNSLR